MHVGKGCGYAASLKRTGGTTIWKSLQQACLSNQAQLALAQGRANDAATYAERALVIRKSIKSDDPVSDKYALARNLLLAGDTYRAVGDRNRARQAWEHGLRFTQSTREQPGETAVRADLLERTGQRGEANRLRRALAGRGIRNAMVV